MDQPNTRILIDRYGPLMCSRDVQQTLRFRTAEGFRAARSRGRLPLVMFRLPGRKGLFARTSDVAQLINHQVMALEANTM